MKIKQSHRDKINELINKINSGYIPKTGDINHRFSDGTFVGSFWNINKAEVIDTVLNDENYSIGYDCAKSIIYDYINNSFSFEDKILEYIEMLNRGYIPVYNEINCCFSNGKPIKYFWNYNKKLIIDLVLNDEAYSKGYEQAKKTINDYLSSSNIYPIECKIEEFIEKLNKGYVPKNNDKEQFFNNGCAYNRFWPFNREKIIHILFNSEIYSQGYETAKYIVLRELGVKSYKEYVSSLDVDVNTIKRYLKMPFKSENNK
ncbi:MAG: hypothetical protein PUD59_00965 [bacterium]|nr:hypothetical protein [bacterium]